MNFTQKLIAALGLCLIGGVVLRSALSDAGKTDIPNIPAVQPTSILAENDAVAPQTVVQPIAPVPQPPKLAAVGEGPKSGPDGKEVIPPDGKEVIPADGKEVIPPVSELLPPSGRPDAVDPANGRPPIEFINKPSPTPNPLLAPANPQNVAGPVVSEETR